MLQNLKDYWTVLFILFALGYWIGYNRPFSDYVNTSVLGLLTPVIIYSLIDVFRKIFKL